VLIQVYVVQRHGNSIERLSPRCFLYTKHKNSRVSFNTTLIRDRVFIPYKMSATYCRHNSFHFITSAFAALLKCTSQIFQGISWKYVCINSTTLLLFLPSTRRMLQRPTMLMRAISSYLWDRRLYPALYVPFYYPSVPNFLLAEARKRRSVGQNFRTRRRTEWQEGYRGWWRPFF